MTVPLAPPCVVSMTLVVRLTCRSSWSKPSSSAQYSKVLVDWFFRMQPPASQRDENTPVSVSTHTRAHTHTVVNHNTYIYRDTHLHRLQK